MKLAYVRELNYFSPSSFMMFESDALGFYLQRLGPKELRPEYERQGFAAGVGSALDDVMKCLWSGTVPEYENVECEDRLDAIRLGNDIAEVYKASGAWDKVKEEGTIVAVEDEIDGFVPGTDVPIRGKLDINWDGRRFNDFKVTGAGSIHKRDRLLREFHEGNEDARDQALKVRPPSPNPGYLREWRRSGLIEEKRHSRYQEPLEALNEKWATQGAFYSWLLTGRIEKCAGAIDQLLPQPDGDVRICQFRTHITKEFQERLRDRVVAAWQKIERREVVDERIPLDMQLLKREMTPWWKR